MKSGNAPAPMSHVLRLRSTASETPALSVALARIRDGRCEIEEARTWRNAQRALNQSAPALIVFDIEFTEGDWCAQLHEIATRHPASPILAHSALPAALYAERALRAGSLGFLAASADAAEATYALEAALEKRICLGPEIFAPFVRRLLARCPQPAAPADLSSRELAVLRLIGNGRPNRTIAHALSISVKTVETHRANLKRKLGAGSTADLCRIATAVHAGPLTPDKSLSP